MPEPRNIANTPRRRRVPNREKPPRAGQPLPLQRPDAPQNGQSTSQRGSTPQPPNQRLAPVHRPELWNQPSRSRRRAADSNTARNPGSFNLKDLLFGNPNRSDAGNSGKSTAINRVASPNASGSGSARGLQAPPRFNNRQSQVAPYKEGASSADSLSPYRKQRRSAVDPRVHYLNRVTPIDNARSSATAADAAGVSAGRSRETKRRNRRNAPPALHLMRLLIFGLGVGAIAGTVLSVLNPTARLSSQVSQAALLGNTQAAAADTNDSSNQQRRAGLPGNLGLGQEMLPLKQQIEQLATSVDGITPGVFVIDLDSQAYLNVGGTTVFPAASTIKVPILIAFLQDVDQGKARLDEVLTMEQQDIAEGSGEMQYQPVGTQYTALETMQMMITISDNTATNMLIRRMGGIQVLNQRFQTWGLKDTIIRNPLADLGGTNTTSPKELTEILARVSQGELLSLRSRDRLIEIMQGTVTDTLIPAGTADSRAVIAHKTGTINNMVGDTGIVDMPTGKRFVITVLAQRPTDDNRAQEMIRQICSTVYNYLSKPEPSMSSPVGSELTTAPAIPAPQ